MAESKKVNHGKKRPKRSVYQQQLIDSNKRKKLRKKVLLTILFSFIYTLASVIFSVGIWYQNTFDITFNDLLFTMLSPIGGTGESTLSQIFSACTPPVIILVVVYAVALILLWKDTPKRMLLRKIGAIFCIVALVASIIVAAIAFKIPDYLMTALRRSELYESDYVDPDSVDITDKDGNAQNLIYIYLESMETTYASLEDGGEQKEANYMPNLTNMALSGENISFSDGDKLGGFRSITGTGWTMGALMGTTSGVPFSLSVFGNQSHNSQGKDGTFVNCLCTLGDILADKGYKQEFLCGSDVSFGGRETYFKVHGNYELFDYYTAIEEGYIASDYKVWWGFEDEILFKIAKDEILDLASGDQPFNFTILTVDPHHVDGYVCKLCEKTYDVKTANVITCQDKQIYGFIEWCKTQDFFENTTIVIVGDHPRMDKTLIGDLSIYDRPMYNCIINSKATPEATTNNRTFTSLDMFPTTLAAMGFEIEGERLGLGTNLFSPVPTLCEKHGGGERGYDWLDREVQKASDYYKDKFVNSDRNAPETSPDDGDSTLSPDETFGETGTDFMAGTEGFWDDSTEMSTDFIGTEGQPPSYETEPGETETDRKPEPSLSLPTDPNYDIYKEEYVSPDTVQITDKDKNARNLIYIYLESLETTYAPKSLGGNQASNNYIPNLTRYASDNVSFSDCDKLGGFRSITGTGWTMGALLGTTSGAPFNLGVFGENSHNSQGKDGTFMNGITTLGDILAKKGYKQEFLCGSDIKFGGRGTYFTVHGNYEIFDFNTALKEGYATEHNGWWGIDDKTLFKIAKDELTKISKGDQPFNFSMLTVYTHHVYGYQCDICGDEYKLKTANVVACQDKQVYEFVEWCKKQDFYKNTTIVIVGDHPRMDSQLIGKSLEIYDRQMYNCIINPAVQPESSQTGRAFTSLDMFPTTLAAMGFEIEGERLGLGTNMFSKTPTLWEKLGGTREAYDFLDEAVQKDSNYYRPQFVKK